MSSDDGKFISNALWARESDRAAAARMRYGIDPLTEARAYSDVLLYAQAPWKETPMLRTAAIVCLHPNIEHSPRESVGKSFRRISTALAVQAKRDNPTEVDPNKPDSVASRLAQLPEQDLDAAAATINRILALGDTLNITIDYYALGDMLLKWGDGISEDSRRHRRKVIRDYYSNN